MLVVAAVNAANPGASAAAGQPQPVWLLVGAAAAAAPLLAGWLLACWVAAATPQGLQRRGLATGLDLVYPLCYVPPLLIIFAGEVGSIFPSCARRDGRSPALLGSGGNAG